MFQSISSILRQTPSILITAVYQCTLHDSFFRMYTLSKYAQVFISFIVEITARFFCHFSKSFEQNECELATKETEGVNGFIVI